MKHLLGRLPTPRSLSTIIAHHLRCPSPCNKETHFNIDLAMFVASRTQNHTAFADDTRDVSKVDRSEGVRCENCEFNYIYFLKRSIDQIHLIACTHIRCTMASFGLDLEQHLCELSATENWQGVIDSCAAFSADEKTKFLWAWPTVECLKFLRSHLTDNDIATILSIGCGSGLLEWMIRLSSGVDVVGLELDNSWWKSAYSPRTFIELKFTTDHPPDSKFLADCAGQVGDRFALLFCYFNNRSAFLDYVRAYDGKLIVIVGPIDGGKIVTDPIPLRPQFESDEWQLVGQCEMHGQDNCMAIYRRR